MKYVLLITILISSVALSQGQDTSDEAIPGANLVTMNSGTKFYFKTEDSVGKYWGKLGTIDPRVTDLLVMLLHPDSITLDIGAHYGQLSVEIAKKTTSGFVFMIEPNPQVAHLAVANMKINGHSRFSMDKVAITTKTGTFAFEENVEYSVAACVVPVGKENAIEVQGITLDDFLQQKQIQKVDLLRADVEGYECSVIFSGPQALNNNPDLIISFEWQYELLKQAQTDEELKHCLDILTGAGYHFFEIQDPFGLNKITDSLNQTLKHIYPEEIYYGDLHELLLVKDLALVEGLYLNLRLSYADFWSLKPQEVERLLLAGRIDDVNHVTMDVKNYFDKLVECIGPSKCSDQEMQILRLLFKNGVDCELMEDYKDQCEQFALQA